MLTGSWVAQCGGKTGISCSTVVDGHQNSHDNADIVHRFRNETSMVWPRWSRDGGVGFRDMMSCNAEAD